VDSASGPSCGSNAPIYPNAWPTLSEAGSYIEELHRGLSDLVVGTDSLDAFLEVVLAISRAEPVANPRTFLLWHLHGRHHRAIFIGKDRPKLLTEKFDEKVQKPMEDRLALEIRERGEGIKLVYRISCTPGISRPPAMSPLRRNRIIFFWYRTWRCADK
jgi:hypothetical protein